MQRIRDEEADATDDGLVLYEGEFYTGELAEIDSNGKLLSLSTYTGGLEDGPWMEWYPDGTKRVEGRYSNGSIVGTWKEWHSNGVLARKLVYENKRLTHKEKWNRNGEQIEKFRDLHDHAQ